MELTGSGTIALDLSPEQEQALKALDQIAVDVISVVATDGNWIQVAIGSEQYTVGIDGRLTVG